MLRTLLFVGLCICSYLVSAESKSTLYQVDMIVFTQTSSVETTDNITFIPPDLSHAISLKMHASADHEFYHLLPPSLSDLRNEYWALNRDPKFNVLFHYTWLQPKDSQRPIAFPAKSRGDWTVEGALLIRQSNYYQLDSELLFTSARDNQKSFVVEQKQRLKPNVVYYLDHPQAGIVIKVHKVA